MNNKFSPETIETIRQYCEQQITDGLRPKSTEIIDALDLGITRNAFIALARKNNIRLPFGTKQWPKDAERLLIMSARSGLTSAQTAAEIAKVFPHITKKMVYAKAHHIKISFRKDGKKTAPTGPTKTFQAFVPDDYGKMLPFASLTNSQCQWIYDNNLCCGHEQTTGSAYCEKHHTIARGERCITE